MGVEAEVTTPEVTLVQEPAPVVNVWRLRASQAAAAAASNASNNSTVSSDADVQLNKAQAGDTASDDFTPVHGKKRPVKHHHHNHHHHNHHSHHQSNKASLSKQSNSVSTPSTQAGQSSSNKRTSIVVDVEFKKTPVSSGVTETVDAVTSTLDKDASRTEACASATPSGATPATAATPTATAVPIDDATAAAEAPQTAAPVKDDVRPAPGPAKIVHTPARSENKLSQEEGERAKPVIASLDPWPTLSNGTVTPPPRPSSGLAGGNPSPSQGVEEGQSVSDSAASPRASLVKKSKWTPLDVSIRYNNPATPPRKSGGTRGGKKGSPMDKSKRKSLTVNTTLNVDVAPEAGLGAVGAAGKEAATKQASTERSSSASRSGKPSDKSSAKGSVNKGEGKPKGAKHGNGGGVPPLAPSAPASATSSQGSSSHQYSKHPKSHGGQGHYYGQHQRNHTGSSHHSNSGNSGPRGKPYYGNGPSGGPRSGSHGRREYYAPNPNMGYAPQYGVPPQPYMMFASSPSHPMPPQMAPAPHMGMLPGPLLSPVAVPMDPAHMDLEGIKHLLRQQIEYYFSIENLCRDIFFRRQMSLDGGWVPLHVVTSFNRVRSLIALASAKREGEPSSNENDSARTNAPTTPAGKSPAAEAVWTHDVVLASLMNSEVIEVQQVSMEADVPQVHLRRRQGWQQWVMVPEGGPLSDVGPIPTPPHSPATTKVEVAGDVHDAPQVASR